MMIRTSIFTAITTWLLLPTLVNAATAPDYRSSPVFYERFAAAYEDPKNLELLPKGMVRLEPIGTMDVNRFDWVRHERQDPSFWQRMEGFDYLLPLIRSTDPAHQDFAKQWFNAWYTVHSQNQEPNVGTWDGMTAGRRAMILTFILRQQERSAKPDQATIDRLKNSIGLHQRFLAADDKFESLSNHGMWQAMGLFETTRVLPDPLLSQLALDRLLQLTSRSVSSQGLHMEHSPSYHFYFLDWLTDFVVYLNGLGDLDWANVSVLSDIEKAMRGASYFMYDHAGNLPQIGDTDATVLDEATRASFKSDQLTLFDPEAGFAVFKDPPDSPARRYIVMRVQNQHFQPQFRHHCHNDVLSVYYARDGEVILSDQGRYSYSRTAQRGYVMSLAAHNTILPTSMIVPTQPGIYVCDNVWGKTDAGPVIFGAQLVNEVVKREVNIPRGQGRLLVDDFIRSGDEFLLLWYLGPDVMRIEPGQDNIVGDWRYYEWNLTTRNGHHVKLQIGVQGENLSSGEEVAFVRGQPQPLLGWYSPGYDQLIPASVVTLLLKPKDEIHVTTEIRDARD